MHTVHHFHQHHFFFIISTYFMRVLPTIQFVVFINNITGLQCALNTPFMQLPHYHSNNAITFVLILQSYCSATCSINHQYHRNAMYTYFFQTSHNYQAIFSTGNTSWLTLHLHTVRTTNKQHGFEDYSPRPCNRCSGVVFYHSKTNHKQTRIQHPYQQTRDFRYKTSYPNTCDLVNCIFSAS